MTFFYIIIFKNILLKIIKDTTWAIYYLVDSGDNMIQVNSFCFFKYNDITGTDEQTQALLNNGALTYCYSLLTRYNEKITKYTVCFLSNIIFGNDTQAQSIIDSNLLPLIINQVSDEVSIIYLFVKNCFKYMIFSQKETRFHTKRDLFIFK